MRSTCSKRRPSSPCSMCSPRSRLEIPFSTSRRNQASWSSCVVTRSTTTWSAPRPVSGGNLPQGFFCLGSKCDFHGKVPSSSKSDRANFVPAAYTGRSHSSCLVAANLRLRQFYRQEPAVRIAISARLASGREIGPGNLRWRRFLTCSGSSSDERNCTPFRGGAIHKPSMRASAFSSDHPVSVRRSVMISAKRSRMRDLFESACQN